MNKKILVTGSAGLIGSEVCTYFHDHGYKVIGIDNNQRAVFFGPQGDTIQNRNRLISTLGEYTHINADIRDNSRIRDILKTYKPGCIVHTAAQPSHDRAASIPHDDFTTNAVGTLNLIEGVRKFCRDSPFVYMSTNKVYGDRPNNITHKEFSTRYDFDDKQYLNGIPETFSIDQSKHSLFGASKLAGDVLVQEYGRYFNMPTCCLRGGCLTGPNHSGVELHGFLNYLVKCNKKNKNYNIYGYKGKQVRDNIHSYDVARFIYHFINAPRTGEVYNIGGGKTNACSILEAFDILENITGIRQKYTYVDTNRIGDHIVYYSDLTKCKLHYPNWSITKTLVNIFEDIAK